MLSRILGVLHNLSKHVPTRVNFVACQALDTLIPLLKAEVALFGAKCLLILAYLIDESNNHMIMADEGKIHRNILASALMGAETLNEFHSLKTKFVERL